MYNDIIQIWMFKFQAIFLIEADVDERACIVTWVRWKLRIWKFFDLYYETKMADICLGFHYKHNMQHTIKYHFGKMGGGGILWHKKQASRFDWMQTSFAILFPFQVEWQFPGWHISNSYVLISTKKWLNSFVDDVLRKRHH